MKPSYRALIDFWMQIGKVRRARAVVGDPASRWRYFFVRNDGIELELKDSWTHFFKIFNEQNLICFLLDLENNFDPWCNPRFIAKDINIYGRGTPTQTYQCLIHFNMEDK